MNLIKRLLLLSVFSFCFLSFADDKAQIEACIAKTVKAGMSMDFNTVKQYCSKDYVKLPNDKKVLDRKLLDRTALYFERIKDPGLTFSELVKLNFMMKGQTLPDAQLAMYRKLDSTPRGKMQVQQAQKQIKEVEKNIAELCNELLPKVEYGPLFIGKEIAVKFYKLDFEMKIKGVLILRKESGQWKLYREFSFMDTDHDKSVATEAEVRKFVSKNNKLSRTFKNYVDLMQGYSKESLTCQPDGSSVDYQQALKKAQFWDMLKNGNPTFAEAAPLWAEASGITVTAEMQAGFIEDKGGQGKKWLKKSKDAMLKHRAEIKKTFKSSIKHIVLFEDCALLIDSFVLPNSGKTERISLIKKNKGEYLILRSASRKID